MARPNRNSLSPYQDRSSRGALGLSTGQRIILAFVAGVVMTIGIQDYVLTGDTANADQEELRMETKQWNVNIQAAITTSTKIDSLSFAMRLWATSLDGWHRDFATLATGPIPIYTFDDVPSASPFSHLLTSLPHAFPGEKDQHLLMAALEDLWRHNPNADWYLVAQDDTIVIRENLELAIQTMELDPTVSSMHGNCVFTSGNINGFGVDVPFVVGRSGILLSAALVAELVPHVPTCRERFNNVVNSGGERLGDCLEMELKLGPLALDMCKLQDFFPFVSGDIVVVAEQYAEEPGQQDLPIVSMHEDDPKRMQLLQTWIRNRSSEAPVTYRELETATDLMEELKAIAAFNAHEGQEQQQQQQQHSADAASKDAGAAAVTDPNAAITDADGPGDAAE